MRSEFQTVAGFDVVSRRRPSKASVASPRDFELRHVGEVSINSVREHGIAYCADFEQNQVLYALCENPKELFHEPFLYLAQHRKADRIAGVPFDLLEAMVSVREVSPVFLLSAGRCGSTLLAALLRASGLPTASEPDLMTQLARDRLFDRDPDLAGRLQRACVSSLADHCGKHLAIKLRSQCNSIASNIAGAFPSARFVFILRDHVAWARSRYRAFPGSVKELAYIYRGAVLSYDRLCAANCSPVLLWYEDFDGDPSGTLQRLADEGLPIRKIAPDDLATIMRRDSQAGTHLASRKLSGSEMTEDQVREFEREWRRIIPDSSIKRLRTQRPELDRL